MHLTHVRKSDLNLLPALAVLLEARTKRAPPRATTSVNPP